ncbi:hypothetical protein BDZ45DRAFT_768557 [Acephala macrosclerotiorum]|nr:hypothetical protein BDZ45DRAFT_768557 [Acephala macrosclerotiorum]
MEPNLRTSPSQADDEDPGLIKSEEESGLESPKVKSSQDLTDSNAGTKVKTISVNPKSTFTNATNPRRGDDKRPKQPKPANPKSIITKKLTTKSKVPAVKDEKQQVKLNKKGLKRNTTVPKQKAPSINDYEDHEDQNVQSTAHESKSTTTPKVNKTQTHTPITTSKAKRTHGFSSPDGVRSTSNKRIKSTPGPSEVAHSTPSKNPTSKKLSRAMKTPVALQKDKNEAEEARDKEHDLSEVGDIVPKMAKKQEGRVRG